MSTQALYATKDSEYYEGSRPEMLQYIPASASRILEIGCGKGAFMAALKKTATVHATGIEMSAEASEHAKMHFDALHLGDLSDTLPALNGVTFDCIVFNDVLEHLVDPWSTLRSVQCLLAPGGSVVASIPNIRYWPVLSRLFVDGEWTYQDYGVLDRTHLRFFTKKSIIDLFKSSGYTIVEISGINSTKLTRKISILNRITSGRFDDTQFRQYAVVATLHAGR